MDGLFAIRASVLFFLYSEESLKRGTKAIRSFILDDNVSNLREAAKVIIILAYEFLYRKAGQLMINSQTVRYCSMLNALHCEMANNRQGFKKARHLANSKTGEGSSCKSCWFMSLYTVNMQNRKEVFQLASKF